MEPIHKKIELPLVFGILLLPVVFSWFTLRRGYSTLTRGLAFSWLVLYLVVSLFIIMPAEADPEISAESPVDIPEEIYQNVTIAFRAGSVGDEGKKDQIITVVQSESLDCKNADYASSRDVITFEAIGEANHISLPTNAKFCVRINDYYPATVSSITRYFGPYIASEECAKNEMITEGVSYIFPNKSCISSSENKPIVEINASNDELPRLSNTAMSIKYVLSVRERGNSQYCTKDRGNTIYDGMVTQKLTSDEAPVTFQNFIPIEGNFCVTVQILSGDASLDRAQMYAGPFASQEGCVLTFKPSSDERHDAGHDKVGEIHSNDKCADSNTMLSFKNDSSHLSDPVTVEIFETAVYGCDSTGRGKKVGSFEFFGGMTQNYMLEYLTTPQFCLEITSKNSNTTIQTEALTTHGCKFTIEKGLSMKIEGECNTNIEDEINIDFVLKNKKEDYRIILDEGPMHVVSSCRPEEHRGLEIANVLLVPESTGNNLPLGINVAVNANNNPDYAENTFCLRVIKGGKTEFYGSLMKSSQYHYNIEDTENVSQCYWTGEAHNRVENCKKLTRNQ